MSFILISRKDGAKLLIGWCNMDIEAEVVLNEADVGNAIVPFKEMDKKFASSLKEAGLGEVSTKGLLSIVRSMSSANSLVFFNGVSDYTVKILCSK